MEISDGSRRRYRSRTRKDGALRSRKRDGNGLPTPPVKWIFDGAEHGPPMGGERWSGPVGSGHIMSVSARKLAAALWHLEARTNSACSGRAGMTWHWRRSRFGRLLFELHSPLPNPEPAMEDDSKWKHSNRKGPPEVYQFHSFVRQVQSQQVATVSVASALQAELVRVRSRAKELETERRLFKKKLKHLLRRFSEEKVSWMKKEEEKMNLIIDELKEELKRERRNYQKMDIINSKLLSDLADAKFSARQLIDDCQKERRARELLEDLCNELIKEIEDSKAAVRSMEIECQKVQEEAMEERKMLQMAEVWREERVQMKLVDARLILEEKYYQINNLIGELESFLRSKEATRDMSKITEAVGIKQAVDAMNFLDIKELRYTPPRSYDIHTIMEDIRCCGAKESEIDRSLRPSPASNINPQVNEYSHLSVYGHSSNYNSGLEEPANLGEDQQSSCSVSSGACVIDGTGGDRCISSVVAGLNQNENQEPLSSSTNTISSEQQFRSKSSSLRRLWRSSLSSESFCKTISLDGNRRLSSASDSFKVDIPPEKVSGEGAFNQHELANQLYSPGQRNPHISRAMKGCIEWPRGIQKYGLKAKLLEDSLESQKIQVRNILKQRIR